MNDAQSKAQELKSGFQELEETIKAEQQRSNNSLKFLRRLLNSRMAFLKTILEYLDINDRSGIWNRKFRNLPPNLQTEILKMKN